MGNYQDMKLLQGLFRKYRLLPISTYAKVEGVTRMTVWRWIRDGKLDYIVLGGIKFVVGIK